MNLCIVLLASALALPSVPAVASEGHDCEGRLSTSRVIELDPNAPGPIDGKAIGLRDGEVVLTYDDGPNRWTTPPVLDALREECVRATFFLLGANAMRFPRVARVLVEDGHAVGSHTMRHPNLAELEPGKAEREIDRGLRATRRALGLATDAAVPLFRAPYFATNETVREAIAARGLVAVGADISGRDWSDNSCEESTALIERQLEERRSGIIIMHDVMGNAACATRAVLALLKRRGMKVVHLRAAARRPGGGGL